MKVGRPGPRGQRPASSGRPTGRAWPSAHRVADRGPAARPVRRRGPGLPGWRPRLRLTPPRAAAILGLLLSMGALNGVSATPVFTLTRTELPALRWTTPGDLAAAAATPQGTNLFRLRVAPIERRIEALPGIADATVSVSLPDSLVVQVRERQAILVWAVGDGQFLVDRSGVLFAATSAEAATAAGLPTITDSREASAALAVGATLDPVDLDAATRFGSLVPADLGSTARSLIVTISDATGYALGTEPRSWVAIFGLYTPSLRTPAMISNQVRTLRSLIAGREDQIERIILADENGGTYIPRATSVP